MTIGYVLESPLAEAFARTLIHSLWEGAVVALALAIALGILRQSQHRYAAACCALAALTIGFVLTLLWLLPARLQSAIPLVEFSHRLVQTTTPHISPRPVQDSPAPSGGLGWLIAFWIAGAVTFHVRGLAVWFAA